MITVYLPFVTYVQKGRERIWNDIAILLSIFQEEKVERLHLRMSGCRYSATCFALDVRASSKAY